MKTFMGTLKKYKIGAFTNATITSERMNEVLMGQFTTFLFGHSAIVYSSPSTHLLTVKRHLVDTTRTIFSSERKD